MKTLDRILHPMLALFLLTVSPAFAVRPYTPVHPDPVLESWRWRAFPELNGLGLRYMAEKTLLKNARIVP